MTDFSQDIENCLEVLHNGGIILYPTDTIWGLGCDATNAEAVDKLIRLKGKKDNNGLIVLLSNERDILQYVAAPDPAIFSFFDTITQPTTVIYENGIGVADKVLNNDGSIAIRLVQEDFCRHLIKRFKKPIVSTSANFSGQPSPANFGEIDTELKAQVDCLVSYRSSNKELNTPSILVKWKNGELFYLQNRL